ncbi:MAG TPA: hypothetical protein DCP08_04635, partial [Chloroflexi bacterium]|nr:hypothetical protein [Chloroflexota bacterium]
GFLVFLSLGPLLFLAYRTYQLLTLRYLMDRDSVTIVCGSVRQVVPLSNLSSIVDGLSDLPSPKLVWLGCWLGRSQAKDMGPLLFYATEPPKKQLFLVTRSSAYALSPSNPSGFLAALESRRQMGATLALEEKITYGTLISLPFWRDRLAQLLLTLGALANAALFAYLLARYPTLPRILPLHFTAFGSIDRIGPKEQILRLPTIGLIIFIANALLGFALHRREPLATYLLAGTGLLAQFLIAIALLHIIF